MKQWVVWKQITNILEEHTEFVCILKIEVAGSSKTVNFYQNIHGVASDKILISLKKIPASASNSTPIYSVNGQSHN